MFFPVHSRVIAASNIKLRLLVVDCPRFCCQHVRERRVVLDFHKCNRVVPIRIAVPPQATDRAAGLPHIEQVSIGIETSIEVKHAAVREGRVGSTHEVYISPTVYPRVYILKNQGI